MIYDYEKSKFYIVSIDTNELALLNVPADIDWAMLVAYHRGKMENIKGTSLYHKYRDMASDKDLIIGSIANDRTRGISLANDICQNYRREGMFFDEILEKAQSGGK